MAEFPNLGKHCEYGDCNRLDFLPFMCEKCSKTFCSDHRTSQCHNCPKDTIHTLDNNAKPIGNDVKITTKCDFLQCKTREALPFHCNSCKKAFCVRHRHQQDHDCEKLALTTPAESKTSLLVKSILDSKQESEKPSRTKPLSAKAIETAAKVNLIKLKLKAAGDKSIPQDDRIYFAVKLPFDEISKPYYFSKNWTVGKIIDKIAASEKLSNLNNIPSVKKLKLQRTGYDGEFSTDKTIEELLITEQLFNGENIKLVVE